MGNATMWLLWASLLKVLHPLCLQITLAMLVHREKKTILPKPLKSLTKELNLEVGGVYLSQKECFTFYKHSI